MNSQAPPRLTALRMREFDFLFVEGKRAVRFGVFGEQQQG